LGVIRLVGEGAITGRVIDATTGEPISEAVVSIGDSKGKPDLDKRAFLAAGPNTGFEDPRVFVLSRVITGTDGEFRFVNLPAGSFNLLAMRAGYSHAFFGRNVDHEAQSITLTEKGTFTGAVISLDRTPTIKGRLLNDLSEPIAGAIVVSYLRTWSAGTQHDVETGRKAVTNDRGEYELPVDQPGNYLVRFLATRTSTTEWNATSLNLLSSLMPLATVDAQLAAAPKLLLPDGTVLSDTAIGTTPLSFPSESGHAMVYPSVYYPSAEAADLAIPISVGAGETRSGIEIVSPAVDAGDIEGRIVGIADAANLVVHLVPGNSNRLSFASPVGFAVTDSSGHFLIRGLPRGQYTAQVVRGPRLSADEGLTVSGGAAAAAVIGNWAKMPVVWAVDSLSVLPGVRRHIELHIQSSFTLTGRITSGPHKVEGENLRCELVRADGMQGTVRPVCEVASDGKVIAAKILPGPYIFQLIRANGESVLGRLTARGDDLTDLPLVIESDVDAIEISTSARLGSLTVTISGATKPTAVAVFPASVDAWSNFGPSPRRFRCIRFAASTVSLENLPDGDYIVSLMHDKSQCTGWMNATTLSQLATIGTRTRVRLGEETRVVIGRNVFGADQVAYEVNKRESLGHNSPLLELADRNFGASSVQVRLAAHDVLVEPLFEGDTTASMITVPESTQERFAHTKLAGSVIDSYDKAPVRRARIVIDGGQERRIAVTDDLGRFQIELLPGYYSIFADKPGYLRSFYGSTRPGYGPGVPIALGTTPLPQNLIIAAHRAGAIAGSVFCNGRPVAGATVRIGEVHRGEVSREVRADGFGRYRVGGLAPGRYIVSALAAPMSFAGAPRLSLAPGAPIAVELMTAGPAVAIIPAYYPGTTKLEETLPITLELGQEVDGIDFSLVVAPVAGIRGVLIGSRGEPELRATVRLLTRNGYTAGRSVTTTNAAGQFEFQYLPPGEYELVASTEKAGSQPAGQPLSASVRKTVVLGPGEIQRHDLKLEFNAVVTGTISTPTSRGRLPVPTMVLYPVAGTHWAWPAASAQISGDRFSFVRVETGRYRLNVSPIKYDVGVLWPTEIVDSLGKPVPEVLELSPGQVASGLVVKYTESPTRLVGTLRDPYGVPTSGVAMLFFGIDERQWYRGSASVSPLVRPATDGVFEFVGMPPGDYWLAAVLPEATESEIFDRGVLAELSKTSIRVRIIRGQTTRQDLSIPKRQP
jgi:hypothetical protein